MIIIYMYINYKIEKNKMSKNIFFYVIIMLVCNKKINMTDFTSLKLVDELIVSHYNRKEKLYLLYDGDGIVIQRR